MSVKMATPPAGLAVAIVLACLLLPVLSVAAAWSGPFGVGIAPDAASNSAGHASGVIGWIFARQADLYRSLAATIRTARTDTNAKLLLLWVSFVYGVLHAAGPGHGKVVIGSICSPAGRPGDAASFSPVRRPCFRRSRPCSS